MVGQRGTKARGFARLREESTRLNGVPLMPVLGGIGWAWINDALGPVVRDCEGRVFTLVTLNHMLEAQFSGSCGYCGMTSLAGVTRGDQSPAPREPDIGGQPAAQRLHSGPQP